MPTRAPTGSARNIAAVFEIIESDFPTAAELEELYGSVGWRHYVDTVDELRAAIERSPFVAVARDRGRLVGLVRGLSDDYSIAYLQDLLVDPDYQRRGVGRSLIEAFMRRYEHVRMTVLLTDDEDRQHAFYDALGFEDTAARPGPPLHTFVMFRSSGR